MEHVDVACKHDGFEVAATDVPLYTSYRCHTFAPQSHAPVPREQRWATSALQLQGRLCHNADSDATANNNN